MTISHASRPRRIFYGWYVVIGLAVVSAVMTGMAGVNLGLFLDPMEKDLGISRSVFGLAQTARLIGVSITSWYIGRYLDRHGARLPMIIAGLIVGLTVVATGFITAGWQLVLLIFISGMTGLQGVGASLYATVPITRWFVRNRGKAFSITFLGIPVGIFFLSPVTQYLIDGVGWRSAWIILGIFGAVSTMLIGIFVIRRQPQDLGELPDGGEEVEDPLVPARPRIAAEYSWTREEAMRSPTFWKLAFVDGLRMGALGTLGLFRIPYFIDNGVDSQVVAFALSVEAAVAALASIAVGWLVDRFPARYVSAASTAAMILTFVVTWGTHSAPRVFFATSLFGIGAQSFQVSQGTLWPAYFGSAHIGRIRGIALPLGVAFSAIAAPLTGLVRDETGSYIIAWTVAGLALAVCTAILMTTPKPPAPVAAGAVMAEVAGVDAS